MAKYPIKLINFLKTHKDLILNNNFELLYKKWDSKANYNELTEMLINAKIDPLPYMTIIPEYMYNNIPINNLSIPNNIKVIGEFAFQDCTSLTNINLNLVEVITFNAFWGCTNLKEIIIPKTIKTLYNWAFDPSINLIYEGSKEEYDKILGNTFYKNYITKYLNK